MAINYNLSLLKELEREKVLEVLYRDQSLQKAEEERIRKLKTHLQQLRWKGAKSVSREYQERSCARCQKALGRLVNRGSVCNGCSHRVCHECQVFLCNLIWKCTVCYAHGEVKIKTGEWFFEEREKKFPSAEISKSQNDMRITDKCHLTTDYGQKAERRKDRRSNSDTAINLASELEKAHSLHQFIHKTKETGGSKEKNEARQGTEEETNIIRRKTLCGSTKRESVCSITSTCSEAGSYDNANITGEIEFAVKYNFKTCTLEITIKACKNLSYGDEKKKKCNPYVKTYLLPEKSSHSKMKTSIKKNTVDPFFNETLKYTIKHSQLETRILQVSLWHVSTLKRKVFLGEVNLPLELWDFEDNSTQSFKWYQLRSKAYDRVDW
ncbi:synaptotagmin-like protein 3 isoform X2 [Xenopus laevis]|uniref:Synaptotagmin-like protein 3 isoform X2 n=1 Tax=Xenopus laevis TaxID=8355 RepID=A0A8J1KN82_XENLA|nr:synaptotagmin-like protein 3 isoform X2 [Xenopus laevis]